MSHNYLLLLCFSIFFFKNATAQIPSIDFGTGAVISVGFQEEWAIGLRAKYHSRKKWSYLGEYNLFFRRDVTAQNTETFGEVALTLNHKLLKINKINIYLGIGYVANNFNMNKMDPDTSGLFIKNGNFNHGAQLKFSGNLPIGKRLKLFADLNLKSFGRRYDTFSFGLLYSIQVGNSNGGGL